MAQNANGTPTSPDSIPKLLGSDLINIGASSSVNAIVDGVQTALNSRVTDPSHTTNGTLIWNGSAWTSAKFTTTNVQSDTFNASPGQSGSTTVDLPSVSSSGSVNLAGTTLTISLLPSSTSEVWLIHMWADVAVSGGAGGSGPSFTPGIVTGSPGMAYRAGEGGISINNAPAGQRCWAEAYGLFTMTGGGTICVQFTPNAALGHTVTAKAGTGMSATRLTIR